MFPIGRRTPLRFAALALTCLAAAHAGVAQSPAPLAQPTSIPTDLAGAILVTGGLVGSEEPRVLVGSTPEWVLPKIVMPRGARIMGAAFQGTTVVTIVNIPGASDSIITQLQTQLLARGWKPQPVQNFGGGFRPAPAPARGAPPTRVTLCDVPQMLAVSIARRDEQSADIAYRITTVTTVAGSGYSICNLPQAYAPAGYKSPFPTLYNPPASADVRASGDCQASLTGSQGTFTALRTAMAPELILDHYARQLADSGWTPAPSSQVSRIFVRTNGDGSAELSLTVSSSPRDQACHDVAMNVKTLRKP